MGLPDLVRHDGRSVAAGNAAAVFGSDDNAADSARCGTGRFRRLKQGRVRGSGHSVDPRTGVRLREGFMGWLWRPGTHFDRTVNVVITGVVRPHTTDNRRHGTTAIVRACSIFHTRVVKTCIALVSRPPFDADAD